VEWVACPLRLRRFEGSTDAIAEQFLYHGASRLLQRCDAVCVWRGIQGADQDVRIAANLVCRVFQIEEIRRRF